MDLRRLEVIEDSKERERDCGSRRGSSLHWTSMGQTMKNIKAKIKDLKS